MFRRRRSTQTPDEELPDQEQLLDETEEEAPDQPAALRTVGPWDDADIRGDDVARVDLGSLRVPVTPATELRVEVDPNGAVIAATLLHAQSTLQLGAFAAPRTAGIWDEVRAEILGSIRGGGGSVEELPGPLGTELRAQVPTDVPGQLAPARFVGVDGPRWFLRGLFTGPAAVDDAAAEPLLALLREVVVVRSGEAMPIREPLPLRLPREATEPAAGQGGQPQPDDADEGAQEGERPPLTLQERGPEITEVR